MITTTRINGAGLCIDYDGQVIEFISDGRGAAPRQQEVA